MLTDDQIAALTPQQRRDLMTRLSRPVHEIVPSPLRLRRTRELWVLGMAVGAVVLLVWIVFLAATLPREYAAQNWDLTWTGFDVLLLALVAATAVLAYLRRQLVALTSFATGMLLVCDAWFDVVTSHDDDRVWSLVSAFAVELPVAALLVTASLRVLRITAARAWAIPLDGHAWDVRIPLPYDEDTAVRRRRRGAQPERAAR